MTNTAVVGAGDLDDLVPGPSRSDTREPEVHGRRLLRRGLAEGREGLHRGVQELGVVSRGRRDGR